MLGQQVVQVGQLRLAAQEGGQGGREWGWAVGVQGGGVGLGQFR
ncbi:hypothetical protein JOF53_006725 [Crossiella equi]|uniref:Uncharacterized protein n=1 Tax=Crossiella equi TaxID=130796 RepID=A0ABS5AMP9_9PSEU|nr:hypothetical protein [Crossiella equi]MBP2477853.1 hypothetical protein [Crossiella equi]